MADAYRENSGSQYYHEMPAEGLTSNIIFFLPSFLPASLPSFSHTFIHSYMIYIFNLYFLSSYQLLGAVLDTEYISVQASLVNLCSYGTSILVGESTFIGHSSCEKTMLYLRNMKMNKMEALA